MQQQTHKTFTKYWNDYTRMVSEAKYKSVYGKGFKIWAPKQMLQRLPIAFGQVKSVNTFTNLKTFKMKSAA